MRQIALSFEKSFRGWYYVFQWYLFHTLEILGEMTAWKGKKCRWAVPQQTVGPEYVMAIAKRRGLDLCNFVVVFASICKCRLRDTVSRVQLCATLSWQALTHESTFSGPQSIITTRIVIEKRCKMGQVIIIRRPRRCYCHKTSWPRLSVDTSQTARCTPCNSLPPCILTFNR